MTLLKLTFILFLTIAFSSTLSGQGRVDKDRILYNIRSVSWKIENDTALKQYVKTDTNLFTKGITIRYFKSDSICKVVKLTKTSGGTQMTTFYFDNGSPILITKKRNNFELTKNDIDLSRVLNSFAREMDTLGAPSSPFYEQYRAFYYFYNNKIRFAVVAYSEKGVVQNVRHDDKNDIKRGMELFSEGKAYLLTEK